MCPKKLKPEDISFILDRLAANRTTADAVDDLKKNHGVTITVRHAFNIKKTHYEDYELRREQFLKNFDDTPIARAKFQLDGCQKIYDKAVKDKDVTLQLSAITTANKIAEPLGLESVGRGATKEVEDFIADLAFGQADTREVQRN
jgi:hypothetical protein